MKTDPDSHMTSSDNQHVVDLTSPEIWTDARFQKMVLQAVKNDGFGPKVVELSSIAFGKMKSPTFAGFCDLLNQEKLGLDADTRQEIDGLLKFLDETVAFNNNCYQTERPETARVKRWPNNINVKARYPEQYTDIHEDFFYVQPHRFITKNSAIGSAGSCFALRIAHQLQLWNYNYVIEEDDLPEDFPIENLTASSFRMAPARMGTLFNVPSMRQMIERAFGEWQAEKVIRRGSGSSIHDLFRTVSRPTDIDAYNAEYETHNAALKRALLKCDVFILTLGLTEAWSLAHSGDFISLSPANMDTTLLRARNLTVDDNVRELERLLDVYRRHRPDIKLIVSVSPVPLNKTFSDTDHVVVANTLSKSILVTAAHEFTKRHPDCTYYFPSYETVLYGTRDPWEADMRHVSPEAVERVMKLFQTLFLTDQSKLSVSRHVPPSPPRSSFVRNIVRKVGVPIRNRLRSLR